MDAGEAVGSKRRVVDHVQAGQADADEQRQRDQLDHDHDVVRARAFPGAPQQQPGDQRHDAEGGQVHQDGDAGHVRRRLQQAVDVRVAAEQRRAVAGREPGRKLHADPAHQRREVVAPRDRHGDVAHRVLEDQVPADDPGHRLAQRRVGVGVGRPGLRDHRRQLRVAQRRQRARAAQQQEREHQRRARAVADDDPVGPHLPRRRRADGPEDAGADDRADGEHDQVAGAQHALERARRVGLVDHQFRNGLAAKEGHGGGFYRVRGRKASSEATRPCVHDRGSSRPYSPDPAPRMASDGLMALRSRIIASPRTTTSSLVPGLSPSASRASRGTTI